jgi:hypothetical protein
MLKSFIIRGQGKAEFAFVHIYYGVGVFEATVMRIRRFLSELIGKVIPKNL